MNKRQSDLKDLKFYIHTFGCQMNDNDSEHIAGILGSCGAQLSDSLEESDLIIINTCAVREKSEEKLYSLLGRLNSIRKKEEKNFTIGVVGCVAQLHRSKLLEKMPQIDFILGPDNYWQIPEIIPKHLEEKIISTNWSKDWHEISAAQTKRTSHVSALVTIMEGCNNFCAYCVVPYTRGREKYRPTPQILAEIQDLAHNGYKEIQLLGQNVNSYIDPNSQMGFVKLLRKVNTVEGIDWIRFITSHPKNFSIDIAMAMKESEKVCHQLHLPVQSGSAAVLQRMNRGYTRKEYLQIIKELRRLMPDICLSTDIIVGFPGESDNEFQETMSLLEEVRYTQIFSFRYSPRPLTKAENITDDVPFSVKKERLMAVQNLQKNIQIETNQALVGSTIKVLCTGRSKKDRNIFSGRNAGYQVINFSSIKEVEDRFVNVQITSCGPYSLRGHTV
jgi:tRNA-2-methylthio-N6-dimethylallyladenosine synthase